MLKFFFNSKLHLKNNQSEIYRKVAKFLSTDKPDSQNKKDVFILKAQTKKPEVKQTQSVPPKPEKFVTMKSSGARDEKREIRPIKTKDEARRSSSKKEKVEEIEFKEEEIPVQVQEKKFYPSYFTQNRYYSRYVKNLENTAKNYFDKIYGNVLNELIRNKISKLENDFAEIKKNSNYNVDNKTQNIRVGLSSKDNIKTQTSSQSNQEHTELFNSQSIKEFEAKLAQLPIITLTDYTFKTNILDFYAERNVDKAFEFFYDNMRHDSIDTSNAGNLSNFLLKLIKYDKIEYLRAVFDTLSKNEVNTAKLSSPVFNFTESFSDYLNYHGKVKFDYDNSLLGLKYVFYHIKNLDKLTIDSKMTQTISHIFDKLAQAKFHSRKISENDDIINIIRDYTASISKFTDFESKLNQTSISILNEESLAKILSLTFDASNSVNDFDLLQVVLDISIRQENFLRYFSENIIAYHQLFGFAPKILSGKALKTKYHELRANIQNKNSNVSPSQLEFLMLLFKLNSLPEYAADCLRNWNDFVGSANAKKQSYAKIYESSLSDFILNSEMENEHFYHKNIEKVFKERNKSVNEQNNVDYLVYKTLAFLKDGNVDFAVEDFFKNLDTNVKNAKESDKELVNFYNQMFLERDSTSTKDETDPELEFELTLRKVNLLEKLRENVINLFSYINENETENKFKIKEEFIEMLKSPSKYSKNDSLIKSRLLYQIRKDLDALNNLNVETIKSELHKKKIKEDLLNEEDRLENIYAKIKVELYEDDYKYQLLSNMLNRNIIHVSDINNIELNERDKQSLLDNIHRTISSINDPNYRKFAQLVQEFFIVKPVSFKRVEFISEDDIYKAEAKQKPATINQIRTDFMKELLSNQSALEELIPKYKDILLKGKNKLKNNCSYVIDTKTESSFKSLVIANNFSNNLESFNLTHYFNKLNKNIARIVDRVSYYKHITLNKIKDNRQRNIIKALYLNNLKISKKSEISSTANYVSYMIHTRNLDRLNNTNNTTNLLKHLNEITNITVSRKDNVYIESIMEELLKYKNIRSLSDENSNSSIKKKFVTTMGKVDKMKELLNQEYEIFSAKHAVYMILYGIEHNMPFAIRIAEKACSDLGYKLPSWVELRLNKYLLSNSKAYAVTVNKVGPVNVANVYRSELSSDKVYDDKNVESLYDNYRVGSIYAVDYLPFKGLEQIVDLKKFSMILKNVGMKY